MTNSDDSIGCTIVPYSTLFVVGCTLAVLKLCGVIDWSWWLVLLPIYAIPFAMAVAAFGAAMCFAMMLPALVIFAGFLRLVISFADGKISKKVDALDEKGDAS